ncbi:hypothetical protein GOODEAATRI_033721 [Goodea atripinnis]|uniref:5'-nucleotidase n=1 Tax=Goodea atripinnis TaxID=208336 RepID=A0ABV0NZU7_9TELE
MTEVSESQLRVAFDGDAVLFSDESERIFKTHGLDKFFEHEKENEDRLLDHVCITLSTFLSMTLQVSLLSILKKKKDAFTGAVVLGEDTRPMFRGLSPQRRPSWV